METREKIGFGLGVVALFSVCVAIWVAFQYHKASLQNAANAGAHAIMLELRSQLDQYGEVDLGDRIIIVKPIEKPIEKKK